MHHVNDNNNPDFSARVLIEAQIFAAAKNRHSRQVISPAVNPSAYENMRQII